MSERFDHKLDLLAKYPPIPFSYDADSQAFTVGEAVVQLEDFAAYGGITMNPLSLDEVREMISESKMALDCFDNILQFSSTYNWLRSLDSAGLNQVSGQVTDAMIDAFGTLQPNSGTLEKGSHWGFGMGFIRPGHPTFNVLGDCACLGVNLYGNMFDQHDFADGFAEYGLHNIDWPAQKVSLYAGAGALAQLCEIETS